MTKELKLIPNLQEAFELLMDPQTTNRVYFYSSNDGSYKKVNDFDWSLDTSSLTKLEDRIDRYALFLQSEKEVR